MSKLTTIPTTSKIIMQLLADEETLKLIIEEEMRKENQEKISALLKQDK